MWSHRYAARVCVQGRWVLAYRAGAVTRGINTTSPVEGYHWSLKKQLSDDKPGLASRRIDWLCYKLTTAVHQHFVFQRIEKDSGMRRNLWCAAPDVS